MTEIHGTCDARFNAVQRARCSGNFDGRATSARRSPSRSTASWSSISGAAADEARTAPWSATRSPTSGRPPRPMTALAALMLVDRGELDLDAPVARYWPEFAANGKEAIEVRHLLGHTSGRLGLGPAGRDRGPVRLGEVDRRARRPGAVVGAGHGVGLPRPQPGPPGRRGRAPGHRPVARARSSPRRSPARSAPTSTIGAPPEHDWAGSRRVIPPPPLPIDLARLDPDSLDVKTFTGPPCDADQRRTRPAWRRAEIGALNGHGNARSVARRSCAVLACGGEVDGVRLLSPETIDLIFERAGRRRRPRARRPAALRHRLRRCSSAHDAPISPQRPRLLLGRLGRLDRSSCDLDARMTVSYVMNRMAGGTLGDVRGAGLVMAAYEGLAGTGA